MDSSAATCACACAKRGDHDVVASRGRHPIRNCAPRLAPLISFFISPGVNRPQDRRRNSARATWISPSGCARRCATSGRRTPIVFASSTQAERDNPYGQSKRAAEERLAELQPRAGAPVTSSGCPTCSANGARPNYNSAVATFCHNIARGLPIQHQRPGRASSDWSTSTTWSSVYPLPDERPARSDGTVEAGRRSTRPPWAKSLRPIRGFQRQPHDAADRSASAPA